MVHPNGVSAVTQPCVLVVEGTHERAFFTALLCSPDLADLAPIDVQSIGGKTQLRTNLWNLAQDPALVRLYNEGLDLAVGVVRDADEDAGAALESVRDALQYAGLPIPTSVCEPLKGNLRRDDGLVIEGVTVSIFIMPGEGRAGALEDLVIDAVQAEDAYTCVEGLFTCLESAKLPLPPPHRMGKARASAYIATTKTPDVHVGTAAEKGHWPFEHAAFDPVKQFLRSLAGA